jgi:hypothetical protein
MVTDKASRIHEEIKRIRTKKVDATTLYPTKAGYGGRLCYAVENQQRYRYALNIETQNLPADFL